MTHQLSLISISFVFPRPEPHSPHFLQPAPRHWSASTAPTPPWPSGSVEAQWSRGSTSPSRPTPRHLSRRLVRESCLALPSHQVVSGSVELCPLSKPSPLSSSLLLCFTGMLSPEGRCKTLDSSADGYVRAEACGVLMLQSITTKALSAAAGGLPASTLGMLSGSAVNQDGRSSALTAPNGPAQQLVMRSALRSAGIEASSVRVLQMHGTGETS
jgi:hypothetical protein